MELVDIVDENNAVIGAATRKEVHQSGAWHRVAAVFLINDQKYVLLQTRQDNGLLDISAAGHVEQGETYEEAGYRELEEELGVSELKLVTLGLCRSTFRNSLFYRRHLSKIFIGEGEPDRVDYDVVRSVEWKSLKDIATDVKNHPARYTETLIAALPLVTGHLEK